MKDYPVDIPDIAGVPVTFAAIASSSRAHKVRSMALRRRRSPDSAPFAVLAMIGLLLLCGWSPKVWASPAATTTALAVTSGGGAVTTVASGSVITLTATVQASGVAVSPGQVNFCDAPATYCTDSHLLGLAQLTSAGTATWKFIPGQGVHSYKAVFVGTNTFASSASLPKPLTVTPASGSTTATSTALSYSGSQGAYSLTAFVPAASSVSPTGTVSFVDTSNANYVLAASSLAATGANAISFLNSYNYLTAATPTSIDSDSYLAVGDFNGDGIPDIAVTTPGSNQLGILSILLGNGDGTFRSSVLQFPGPGEAPYYIVTADFNNDGKLDLVTASETGLKIMLGNGDGTFQPAQTITNAIAVIAAADVNGDGNIDIVQVAGGAVTVLLGNGDGTFTPASRTSPVSGGTSLVVADFNGDGKPDIAVTDYMDGNTYLGIDVLLGNGDGTFGPQTVIAKNASVYGLAAADLSGNGKIDLVATNNSNLPLTILMGNGDGTFTQLPSDPATAFLASAVAVADFNGDGIPDLAVPDAISGNVYVLLGKGDGTFTVDTFSPSIPYFISDSIVTGDFNGDGQSDMAAGFYDDNLPNINDDQVKVWLGQAANTSIATVANISPVGTGTHYVDAIYAGDSVYTGSTSNLVPLLAQQVPTALTLTATPSAGSSAGQSVTLTATLTPFLAQDHSASGAVKFTTGSINLGSPNVSNGIATLTTTALPTGANSLKAAYAGDTNFTTSTSSILAYPVSLALQTITFPPPGGPILGLAYVGTSALLTASASSGLPVSYTVVSGPAYISDLTQFNDAVLTYTGVGSVVVEADQAGGGAYAAAAPVQVTIPTYMLTAPVGEEIVFTTTLVFSASGRPYYLDPLMQGAIQGGIQYGELRVAGPAQPWVGCSSMERIVGATCTLEFSFVPMVPGLRNGAVVLRDAAGAVLATSYIFGLGVGPQVNYLPGARSTLVSGLTQPAGIAFDGAGNLFIADGRSGLVLEALASNNYATVKTIGTGFNSPVSVAIDGAGNIFVADTGASTVDEVLAAGGYTTTIALGSGFNHPTDVKVDGFGNVFVADTDNGAVKEITVASGYKTVVTLSNAFSSPGGLGLDTDQNLFVAGYGDGTVKELSAAADYTTVQTVATGLQFPVGLAVNTNGDIFVASQSSGSITELFHAGGYQTNRIVTTSIQPAGIALDGSGNLYVSDYLARTIVKFDYADPPSLTFMATPVGSTSIDSPQTVTITNSGNADLIFAMPGSGNNPSISSGFTIGSTSTCPQLAAGSSAITLAAGASCTDVISFTPVTQGTINGQLITTDDNLNAANATQTVLLNGIALSPPVPTVTGVSPNTGPVTGGTVVTITGTNFTGTTSVLFGTHAATFTVVSATQITATAPSGSGSIDVTVTAPAGTSAISVLDQFTYIPAQAQTITFPQPASPAYAGTSVTLTASSTSGLPVTYTVVSGPATVSGTTLTYTGPGTVVVQADQAGDAAYFAAASVQATVTATLLTEPLTTTSPAISTVITFTASGTLSSIGVFTRGAANLDFNFVSGGTCTVGAAYTAGQTCTVAFTFTPTRPGLRYGGIALADSAGVLLANSYIYGKGNGPQVIYSPVTTSMLGSGFNFPSGVALDGNGNLFVSDNLTTTSGLAEIFANGSSRVIGSFPAAQDVAVDGSGNVFIANNRTTVSEVLAVNGTIPATPTIRTISTAFVALNGMKVDANGNIFLASGSAAG
ncbi:MAG TPA: FG-GAP-like repeat-containing protein, partial [Acidobacteriaceae bacterium]